MTGRLALRLGFALAVGGFEGCATNGDCTGPAVGGPVVGIVDNHCWGPGTPDGGLTFGSQAVEAASCYVIDGGPYYDEDAGAPGPPYGPTNWNSSSNDDDCKYFVGWHSTPISADAGVTFWVSAQLATNGAPLTGLASALDAGTGVIYLEAAGDPDGGIFGHVSPTIGGVGVSIQESPPHSGVYQIGPAVFFDKSGLWYIRFHFNENCDDVLPDSPHGHAAFYVNVP